MPPEPLLQFGTVTLQPAPNGGVVDLQAAFLQKLFNIPKRQGVSKVPAHGAENQDGFGISSGYQSSYSGKLQHIRPEPS
jgi:hypothetical protein